MSTVAYASSRRLMRRSRKFGFERWFCKIQFGTKQRKRQYEKLAQLLRNGVVQVEALDLLYTHASQNGRKPSLPAAVAIAEWVRKTDDGNPLGEAMRDWIPEQDFAIINAGDKSGKLIQALDNVVLLHEKQRMIRGAIWGSFLYPLAILLAMAGFLYKFGTDVVPAFSEVLPQERWYGVAASMGALSDFVVAGGLLWVFGGIAALSALIAWSMPRWTGPIRTRFDRFPPYSIYRLVRGSGFLLSLAILQAAGMKPGESLLEFRRGASPWYRERIDRALSFVRNGKNVGEALWLARHDFPDAETVTDLRAYAAMSEFDAMLMRIGKSNIEEAVDRIQAQSKIVRLAFIMMLGVVFAWVVYGVFDLQALIQASVRGLV